MSKPKPRTDRTGYIRFAKRSKNVLILTFGKDIVGTFPRYHIIFTNELRQLLDNKREYARIFLSRITAQAPKAMIDKEVSRLEAEEPQEIPTEELEE